MAKTETAAQRYARLNKIEAVFHLFDVSKNEKTTALNMAKAANVDPARLFKTLVVASDTGKLACVIVPANCELDRKALARIMTVKRIDLAPRDIAMKSSGYQMGACSPLGQKKVLPVFLDDSANAFETIYVSGGAYGLQMEIAAAELAHATNATLARIT